MADDDAVAVTATPLRNQGEARRVARQPFVAFAACKSRPALWRSPELSSRCSANLSL
jgi:hypothetical protein